MPKADANNLGGVVYYVGVVTAQHLVSNKKKVTVLSSYPRYEL